MQEIEPGVYSLKAAYEGAVIDLVLRDLKGPVLHGEAGYSQKGPKPGDASYYYSLTDLATSGQLSLDGETYPVSGSSWMDHEFSTSALSPGQVGWDWFSIQLPTVASSCSSRCAARMAASILLERHTGGPGWLDPPPFRRRFHHPAPGYLEEPARSGGVYPSGWEVSLPGEDLLLRITPLLRDQELNLTYNYWEGAVQVEFDVLQPAALRIRPYVELTGYAGSMSGEF